MLAISCLREYLEMQYRSSEWMLYHPGILKTSFERLVGPRGGGSRESQSEEIGRIQRHLGIEGDLSHLADDLYDRGVRTFSKGQAGRWKTSFSQEDRAAFDKQYSGILTSYGYGRE